MNVGLLEAMKRSWRTVLAVTLGAGLVVGLVSLALPATYEAQTRLYLASPQAGGVFGSVPPFGNVVNNTFNEAQQVTAPQVLEAAAAELGEGLTLEELEDRVSASAPPQSDVIEITASASAPERAAQVADTVGRTYEAQVTAERQAAVDGAIAQIDAQRAALEEQVAQTPPEAQGTLNEQIADLQVRARQLAVDRGVIGSGIYRFQAAQVPEAPARPLPLVNALVAAALGLLAAAGYAWWRAEHRTDVGDRLAAADLLQAPLLGVVPDLSAQPVGAQDLRSPDPGSSAERAFEFVIASIKGVLRQHPGAAAAPAVLVVGVRRGAGATLSVLNLGFAAARGNHRVVLVDADFRRQGLTRLTDLRSATGLSEAVRAGVPAPSTHRVEGPVPVEVLPTGSAYADPFAVVASDAFASTVADLRGAHDFVLLDAPPPLEVADPLAAAAGTSGVVLVVDKGASRDAVTELRLLLEHAEIPLLGYLYNEHAAPGTAAPAAEALPRPAWTAETPQVGAGVARMAHPKAEGAG